MPRCERIATGYCRREFLGDLVKAAGLAAVAPAVPSLGTAVEVGAPVVGQGQRLWYRQPARRWLEALPLGNGRIGAMVFGGVTEERVALNEVTFWSGSASTQHENPQARAAFEKMTSAGSDAVQSATLCKDHRIRSDRAPA